MTIDGTNDNYVRILKNRQQGDLLLTEIKNIGRFCSTDNEGYILNDTHLNNIEPAFFGVIQEAIDTYRFYLGDNLHSVYIRGSIPRDIGIKGVSDLDTLVLIDKNIEDIDFTWTEQVQQNLDRKFTLINGIEMAFYHVDEVSDNNQFFIIPFIIKTHSICVFGDNLIPQLPNYKVDKTLGNEHLFNLAEQIQTAKNDLENNEDQEDILDCCSWIMKIIVRAGLALVIEDEHKYTRDLYPAYQLFSKHYPEKETEMRRAVKYTVDPSSNPDEITAFLNHLGDWMIDEAEKWLQKENPELVPHMKI